MKEKKTEKQRVKKIVVGGLRETIRVHGPITKRLIGSAAKRIAGTLLATAIGKNRKDVAGNLIIQEEKNEGLSGDAK